MPDLRQSTSQIIRFGPFVDSTDGVTPETALTIAQADMQLSKDGGAFAQKNATGNATHDVDGYYSTTLNATDTNTAGILRLQVTVAGSVLVWEDYDVVTASYYDAKYSGTYNNFDPAVDAVANVTLVDTCTTNTDMRGTDGANTTTPPTAVAIADQVWDEDLTGHQTSLSAGRAATLGGVPIAETTATGTPTTSSIQLTAGSTTDGFYEDQTLKIVGGAGLGQARIISSYTGATRTCTFDEVFVTAPISGDAVCISLDHVHPVSEITADIDANSTQLAAIVADTNELQTDDIPTLIAALPTASEINAEMVDVMEVDTHAQPSSVPAATTTYQNMLTYAFTLGRNKMTQTATTTLLRNDADSATIGTSTVSDDATTFTKGKFV